MCVLFSLFYSLFIITFIYFIVYCYFLYLTSWVECVHLFILLFSVSVFTSIHYFLLPGCNIKIDLCLLYAILLMCYSLHLPAYLLLFLFFIVYSIAVGCSESLGMKSRLISDNQLSASSAYRTWGIDTFTWLPHYARLDKQGKTNAWSPASNSRTEWLQVTCVFYV